MVEPALETAAPTVAPTPIAAVVPIVNAEPINAPPSPDVPNRLLIPAIGLDAEVVPVGWSVVDDNGQQVSKWDVPDWAAGGWLKTSALVGQPGNTVIIGHQNIAGRIFENLENLQAGDVIQAQAGALMREYLVAQKTIVPEKGQPPEVRAENVKWIRPTEDERLTLVTCWPRNNNTHRLIVVAYPVASPAP
ncbi:MAG TPA: sortase [Anaerolineae bacterium]|nr:sortase [Anaerolineae bacterium]